MKAIKIIYGNITKRINSGAKNYEDLINITQKIFQFKEGESFDLFFTKDTEEHILENNEQYQKLLLENEGNKPIKLKLEKKNNLNYNSEDPNFLNKNELKNNLMGMAYNNSINAFKYGDAYYKNELLSDIDNIIKENLKNFSKTLISEFENNSLISKNNLSPTGDKVHSNLQCSNCLQNITIIKYECLICDNLILCEKCINVHSIHPLIMFNLSSNSIKNKNDIENYYKNKLQPKIEEEILNKIIEDNEKNQQIEQSKENELLNKEEKKLISINENIYEEGNKNNGLINNEIQVRNFNLKISLSSPPKHYKVSENEYQVTFSITNNSDYDLTKDDISLFPLLFDEELIIWQNEKLEEIKVKEKKEVSINFIIKNKQKKQYKISFIIHNENSNNKINTEEFQYILDINQIPKIIHQNANKSIPIQSNNENHNINFLPNFLNGRLPFCALNMNIPKHIAKKWQKKK